MKKYQDLLSNLRQSFLTVENGQPLVLDKYFKEVFDELERGCKLADSVTSGLIPVEPNCKDCTKCTERPEYKALNKIKEQFGCDPAYYGLDFEFHVLEQFIKDITCEECRRHHIVIED